MVVKNYYSLDEQIKKEWTALWESSPLAHFFNSPLWLESCLEAFSYDKLIILALYEDEKLVGVLPLVSEKRFGIKTFCSPGGRYLDRSTALVADDYEWAIEKLISDFSQRNNLYLESVDPLLANYLSGLGKELSISKSSVCPYLPRLDDPFRFIQNKKRKRISGLIDELGDRVCCRTYWGSSGEMFEILKEIESQSPKKGNFKDIFWDGQLIKLCSTLNKINDKSVLICLLYLDEKAVAFLFGFVYKETFHGCNMAYTADSSEMSPGRLLAYMVIPDLQKMGINTFDFTRGKTQFKKEFTPHFYQQYLVFYSSRFWVRSWWKLVNWMFKTLESNPVLFDKVRVAKNLIWRKVQSPVEDFPRTIKVSEVG